MANRTVFTRTPDVPGPGDYPTALWNAQRAKYWEYWNHFDGGWLDDTISESDTTPKYPLQLNPYNMACLLHAGFLFGEVGDGNDPLVSAVIEPWGRDSTQEQREQAARLTDLVNRVWYENSGRALQQEAGLISQILGGCIFGVAYDPTLEAEGRLPIRIDHVLPEYFFPVPSPTQYWQLLELFIAFEVTKLQANRMYGLASLYDNALYQEWWKPDSYEITVEGQPVSWGGIPLSGRPLGGRIPYTYIPHIRAGEFYGISLLDRKLALAEEINERMADVGDIVSENARVLPTIMNTSKVTVRRLSSGMVVLDLGRATPGTDAPDIKYPTDTQPGAATVQWATDLLNIARTEAYTPPVCYGLDEGSQRSGLTLALRMIPLLVHIRQERTYWTSGMNHTARMILEVAAEKGIEGIAPEMLRNNRVWQEWAPVLPRDHEALVNELILRLNSGLIAPETALERLGDMRDIQTELNLIKAWMEYKAKVNLNAQMQNPFGGAGSGGEQAGLSRPNEPQPTLKEK